MIAGIATGLTAAFCQSLTYLAARHYVQRRVGEGESGASRELLVLSHVWMALFALLLLPFACSSYSFADWTLPRTCKVIESLGPPTLQASLITVALCHGLCGIAAIPALPIWGSRKRRDWAESAPYALLWFVAMLFLYWCF